MRRILLLSALLALGLASGAEAANPGNSLVRVDIDFPDVDSSEIIAGTRVNDTVTFGFGPFSYDGPWTAISVHFAAKEKDTSTATGLCRDSITFVLQTKVESDSVSYWKSLGATTKYPMAAWDSNGTAAARSIMVGSDGNGIGFLGDGFTAADINAGFGGPYRGVPSGRILVSDADSSGTISEVFRIMAVWNAEEDSVSSHMLLQSAGTKLRILNRLTAFVRFHLR